MPTSLTNPIDNNVEIVTVYNDGDDLNLPIDTSKPNLPTDRPWVEVDEKLHFDGLHPHINNLRRSSTMGAEDLKNNNTFVGLDQMGVIRDTEQARVAQQNVLFTRKLQEFANDDTNVASWMYKSFHHPVHGKRRSHQTSLVGLQFHKYSDEYSKMFLPLSLPHFPNQVKEIITKVKKQQLKFKQYFVGKEQEINFFTCTSRKMSFAILVFIYCFIFLFSCT